ncbi:esterase [Actinomadura logoneensis]|uniref:Esterase n=1 Tax=Actinomadura logoneensis TaxID=2293572 RepID=A0A372JNA3_9ACTN|nr:alpha/beta hydrolase-fold protein [Actinomadura logoneensis]RFU41497.1 esterase [Actinomadura logoneensis]
MSLLGWPLLVLFVLAALAAPLGCLAAWNRVPGPRAARAAARLGMIALCQATALLVVGTLLNRSLHLYPTWADLLGTAGRGGDIEAAGPTLTRPAGGRGLDEGGFRFDRDSRTHVGHPRGAGSGIRAEVRVWLPPQYDDPRYRGRRFPVIELLPGFPGSSWTWFGALHVAGELEKAMRNGQAKPYILVSPTITVEPGRDTECADIPGGPRVATWLTTDVRTAVTRDFRALPDAGAWAAMGYSTGGFCAVKLAEQRPDLFRAAVSLAGYFTPTSPDITRDPNAVRANSPLELLAARPPVDLLLGGTRTDRGTAAAIAGMVARVQPPTKAFTYVLRNGGHLPKVWEGMLPKAFEWLTQRVAGPS